MTLLIRWVVTAIAVVFTLFVVGLIVDLVLPSTAGQVLGLGAAAVAAWAVGRFAWRGIGQVSHGLASSVALGALITGGIGFAGGFFGPIIFAPDANQGPLLGIFITGPLGFVLGAIGGAVYWAVWGRASTR